MDIFNTTTLDQKILTPTRKRKAAALKDPSEIQSKRARFLSTYYRHQNLALPDSIIHYITKGSPKIYQKLVQTCKYFFIKYPIIVVEKLNFTWESEWEAQTSKLKTIVDFSNVSRSKFWITNVFEISFWSTKETPKLVSSIIPKLYRIDTKKIILHNQEISMNEFLFLSSKAEFAFLKFTIVKDKNGIILPIEKVVAALPPQARIVKIYISHASCITANTVAELLKIQHFSKFDKFCLHELPDIFDIDAFFDYIKKNKHTKISVTFKSPSEAYKIRLESIIDEILAIDEHDFKLPYINFPDLDFRKFYELYSLFARS